MHVHVLDESTVREAGEIVLDMAVPAVRRIKLQPPKRHAEMQQWHTDKKAIRLAERKAQRQG